MKKEEMLGRIAYLYLNDSYTCQEIEKNIGESRYLNKKELLGKLQSKTVIGVVFNWKGTKEENYLLYGSRLREVNKKLFEEIYKNKTAEKYLSANKSAYFVRLDSRAEVESFLNGKFNEREYALKDEDFFEDSVKESPMKIFRIMFGKEAG